LLGKVCLLSGSASRQKQVVQRLLFLTPLLQLVSLPLLITQFAEYLAVLMSALIDGKLLDSLGFKLLQPEAQRFGRIFELQLTLGDLQQVDAGQFQSQLVIPLRSKPVLIDAYFLQLSLGIRDLSHNAVQRRLFRVFHALPKAQNCIELEAKRHD
jgi:hypothetical protein